MIARVAVDVPVKAVDRLFDYIIPEQMQEVLEIGMRVVVPFGNRELMAYVIHIVSQSEYPQSLKSVQRILDLEPYLSEELIAIALQIAKESATVFIRVLETILPSALRVVYQTKIRLNDAVHLPKELSILFQKANEVVVPSTFSALSVLKRALRDNIVSQVYDVSSKGSKKQTRWVIYDPTKPLPKSEKQKLVIRLLLSQPDYRMKQSELLANVPVTSGVLLTLEKNGLIRFEYIEEYREVKQLKLPFEKNIILNEEQSHVVESLRADLGSHQVVLLHGVTGSGKTEVYLTLIDQVLSKNQQAIFLVPEISLTPQMVLRVKGRFGKRIAILHSALSVGEKYDEWRRIIRKEVDIVVGARSAVFAPLSKIGLICIDECHEQSYIQEESPRYYAIDVAIERAKWHNALVLMGSATPNIETCARTKRGHIKLLELHQRYLASSFPKPLIVDMKEEFIKGNHGLLSNALIEKINERLQKKEQTILLINRRGYSNFVMCRLCGHVVMCQNCDISLTYHEVEHALKCHYCGHKEAIPKVCPKCQSEHLRFMGTGSQRIESELKELFPEARTIRMDGDTTKTKNAHEVLLNQFETDGDILLGTQMIAKGLDYPRVTLVGIISADSNLFHADFRAPERTFQLITQVSGRAGRNQLESDCVIQVHNPMHYAIFYASNQDYQGFYQYEMRIRKLAKYLPFYYMIEMIIAGPTLRDNLIKGKEIVKTLKQHLSLEAIILGPLIPEISRIKNRYLTNLTIKYRHEEKLDELLFQIKELYETDQVSISFVRSSKYV